MNKFKINVLGTDYTFLVGSREEIKIDADCQGLAKPYSKEILICDEFEGIYTVDTRRRALEEVIVHELAHAFLYESGLVEQSNNEALVEWISIMVRKITNATDTALNRLI